MKKLCLYLFSIFTISLHSQIKTGSGGTAIVSGAQFQINGTATMNDKEPNTFIYWAGRVGINTTRPFANLEISNCATDTYTSLCLSGPTGGRKWYFNSGNTGNFFLWDGTANADRFFIDTNGNVGIVSETPTSKLEVNGEITATAIKGPSDIRFKKNIKPIENALNKVTSLKGYSYEWRKEEFQQKNFKSGQDIGLIAQEVEKIIPEVVYTAEDEMKSKSIDYTKLIPLLIESIKELNTEIENLKTQINQFKK